jgi:excisionase family DNA binding protein
MTVRLASPASPDADARRRASEDRVRTACSLLAESLIDLGSLAPVPEQPVELLSVEEAARRLGGIARSTLYQLMGTGAVRSVEVGGRRFVPSSEVEAIAAGRPGSRSRSAAARPRPMRGGR